MASRNKLNLHKLCSRGSLEEVKEVVEELDDEIFEEQLTMRSGDFGYTLVHVTVFSGRHEVLEYLLRKARNTYRAVNVFTNSSGYTPLHLAASSGHVECVKVLLTYGADISLTDKRGKTPLRTAVLSAKSRVATLLRTEGKAENSYFSYCF